MIVINGENCVLGRVLAQNSKKLLAGEQVIIVNAEKMVITGAPKEILKRYLAKFEVRDIANPRESPRISRRPDYFVKTTLKGMLPSESKRRQEGMRLFLAYMGVPKEFEGKGVKMCEFRDMNKPHTTVLELCKQLGWKGGME